MTGEDIQCVFMEAAWTEFGGRLEMGNETVGEIKETRVCCQNMKDY